MKGPTELMYSSSEKEYNLHSEDVRAINMKHKKIEVRRNNRQPIASNKVTILLDEGELGELKLSCWMAHKMVNKTDQLNSESGIIVCSYL